MSDSFTVTYEPVRSGQPRPYADRENEGYLTFSVPEGQGWSSKFGHMVEQRHAVKPYVSLICRPFFYDKEAGEPCPPGGLDLPYLKTLEMSSPGRWRFVVVTPYID